MSRKVFRDCLDLKMIIQTVKGLFGWFCASSRAGLGLLVWSVFVGIIYAIISLEGEGCYYLISNNMLDKCCLMNVDICMLIC